VRLSKLRRTSLLHVDIGGGTTKLALVDDGVILGVAAFAVGGRLIAMEAGRWTRVDESARLVARELGLATDPETLADADVRRRIAARLAAIATDYIVEAPRDAAGQALALTEPLGRAATPTLITFSGGVSEYIFGHESRDYGDIARLLAEELSSRLAGRSGLPLVDPGQRIRATVIGASQFTVQVSGKTIYLPDPGVLPVHNVPVVQVNLGASHDLDAASVAQAIRKKLAQLDLDPALRLAVAFSWSGDPDYPRLREAAAGIRDAVAGDLASGNLLLLMIDGDIGRSIGHLLDRELGAGRPVVAIDGVQLQDLDYVDLGEMITPPGVVPVVIKSLLFS
jgi:ethanolamine utilization protein EutA